MYLSVPQKGLKYKCLLYSTENYNHFNNTLLADFQLWIYMKISASLFLLM